MAIREDISGGIGKANRVQFGVVFSDVSSGDHRYRHIYQFALFLCAIIALVETTDTSSVARR